MYLYPLATDLLALTALFVGLLGASSRTRLARLLPLFLLVIGNSLALIIVLGGWETRLSAALELFSIFFMIWALGITPNWDLEMPPGWAAWLGSVAAIGLTLLTLLPFWPVPYQIHGLLLAMGGAFFIFLGSERRYEPALIVPLLWAGGIFSSLLGLVDLAWFMYQLTYTAFIGILHWQSLQFYDREHQMVQALVQEAYDLNKERQRWLEISDLISNVPNLSHSVEHIARTVAQSIHVDQVAIFVLDYLLPEHARLLTLYSPQQPFHITDPDNLAFPLAECPPLQQVMASREQLLLPHPSLNGLHTLYELWNEDQTGPTLLQPLAIQGKSIGALMLGNPVSRQPIRAGDARLCRSLATQIAILIEHRRRYLELENETRQMMTAVKKQTKMPYAYPQAILEAISDGVVVSNTEGRVQFVNLAAERILGKPGRALLGQSIKLVYQELDPRAPGDDFVEAFAQRVHPLSTFIENGERAIQGRLIPWRDQEAKIWLGVIAIFRDVSREVKADRARMDFISALSRELRTPLTIIQGYSELITNEMLGDYSAQQLKVQHAIHSSAEQMAEILDNAIRISAQNRHQVLPRFEEVNVTSIIEGVLREMTSLARLHELSLTHEIEEKLPPVTADPQHLHRILFNLLSNACRYTPPRGRIILKAWVQPYNLGRETRPYLFITITDNGIGIPKDEITRIFDRFYRLRNQNPGRRGGMGMGLTVVKELVELHNGRVWVESVVGQGSVFHVALPTNQEF